MADSKHFEFQSEEDRGFQYGHSLCSYLLSGGGGRRVQVQEESTMLLALVLLHHQPQPPGHPLSVPAGQQQVHWRMSNPSSIGGGQQWDIFPHMQVLPMLG